MRGPWYITGAALREYAQLAQLDLAQIEVGAGPDFEQAERELIEHCEAATDSGRTGRSGAQVWRTGRVRCGERTRPVRLELTVQVADRPEGDRPQLVRVRAKEDGSRGGKRPGAGRPRADGAELRCKLRPKAREQLEDLLAERGETGTELVHRLLAEEWARMAKRAIRAQRMADGAPSAGWLDGNG